MFNLQKNSKSLKTEVAKVPKINTIQNNDGSKDVSVNKSEKSKWELLEYHIIVPRNRWELIPKYSLIKYDKKDGTFSNGGYVIKKWGDNKIEKFQIETELDKKSKSYKTFPVILDEVKTIYKRIDHHSIIETIILSEGLQKVEKIVSNNTTQIDPKKENISLQDELMVERLKIEIEVLNKKCDDYELSISQLKSDNQMLKSSIEKIATYLKKQVNK